ncbi:MAG: GC-type dockerin domain-anchored protein [Phycisphaerales bacterium]
MKLIRSLAVVLSLAAPALAAPPEFHTQVAAGTPLLWYKFNETGDAGIFVNSGSLGVNFNMDIPAGVATDVTTIGGDPGVRFDGSAGQFLISDAVAPASLTGDPTFSCETIVKVTSNTTTFFGYPPFLHWGAPTTGQSVYFSLHLYSASKPYVGFYNGGLRAVCDQPLSQFVHIVWTHQGGGGQWGGSSLYINGRLVPLEHDDVLIGAPNINVTSTQFRVNAATDGQRRFAGVMDELALYDRVLTQAEVTAHASTLTLPKCSADVANLGGSAACAGDGSITADDLIVFLGAFFGGNLQVADIAALGGSLVPDGQLTADDIIAFLSVFFAGCA